MRLIDAEKLTELLENTFCAGCEHYDHAKCRACTIDDVFQHIGEAEEIETINRGTWGSNSNDYRFYVCSECHMNSTHMYRYCIHCGALMRDN